MTEFLAFLMNCISMITVFDVLDILIVAFLLYKLAKLIRNSNAAQVIKGIVLLLILMLISQQLHLSVVNFILTNFMQVGVLAIVIIFQPELRKMLEHVGSSKLTQILDREEVGSNLETAITQTVEACNTLSWSRTGALIVFERKISLDDVLKTGTILNADVSDELLKNIFYTKAPLHDGAAIVRNGRILAAGCMLPMSGNTSLSKELGMRHRAGVGISENSDAVVVIVSEESGSISVAINGMLKRHLAPETLEKLLRNELMPTGEENKKTGLFSFLKVNK